MSVAQACRDESRVAGIPAALQELLPELTPAGAGRWTFSIPGEAGVPGRLRVRDGWYLLAAPLAVNEEPAGSLTDMRWLARNAALPALCKHVADSADSMSHLCAEIPPGECVEAAIHEVCVEFLQAAGGERTDEAITESSTFCPSDLQQIKAACTEAGWLFNEHNGKSLTVPLEVPDAFYQAGIESKTDGAIRLFVELANIDALDPVCTRAVALLLLLTNTHVHMIRAVSRQREQQTMVGLEVLLPGPATASSLAYALSALSIGCAMCGREVDVLQDGHIARQYLECQGLTL